MRFEETALVGLALLAAALGCGALLFIWRLILRGELRTRRWAMKLPIYCVAYNLGWLIASIVALPLFGKLVMVLNPVYLVALQYQRTFERILNSLERVIALHSQLGGIVFLMFYVLAVSTFLWAVLGFIVGAGMDISGWTPGKRASSAENA